MRYLIAACFLFVAGVAHADGPVVYRYTSPSPQIVISSPTNSTAQGVAEMCARNGQCRHFGGNRGYEGVGMGSTPEQALSNCCYSRSGMAVVDQGVAYRNGRWYACKRYR